VIGVGVGVDQVGDLARHPVGACGIGDGSQQVVADGRRGIHDNDAIRCAQEHRVVETVGHPVEVAVDPADEVPVGVERRAEGFFRDRREIGEAGAGIGVFPSRGVRGLRRGRRGGSDAGEADRRGDSRSDSGVLHERAAVPRADRCFCHGVAPLVGRTVGRQRVHGAGHPVRGLVPVRQF